MLERSLALAAGCGRRLGLDQPTILARIAHGDGRAVQECLDRYGGLVWSLARRIVYTHAEAEDAVQEIFVEIWRNAAKFDPKLGSEIAFVAMLARRRLIDRRRKLDRRHDTETLPEAAPAPPILLGGGDEAMTATTVMDQLTEEQRRCLRLSVCDGLSHEKIAVSTGLPLGTVKTHLRRGLIRMRALLGGTPTDMRPAPARAPAANVRRS